MTVTCKCGVIVDGGPPSTIPSNDQEKELAIWEEYSGLCRAMVLHAQATHAAQVPLNDIALWCLAVESAKLYQSSDARFPVLRQANCEALCKRLADLPAHVAEI